nr:MAG TPA: hypothetical protein [Caudoviricetes sp.]
MVQRVIVLGTKGYSSWYIKNLESVVFIGGSDDFGVPILILILFIISVYERMKIYIGNSYGQKNS